MGCEFKLSDMQLQILDGSSQRLRLSAKGLKVLLGFTLLLLSGCKRSAQENSLPEAVQGKANRQAQTTPLPLPDCDPSPNNAESSKVTGHHQVVLTWNASPSSIGPSDQAIGYCIYRTRNADITSKDLGHCENCTRLNRRPIFGIGCVDNRVEDGTTYYYVAAAISARARVNRFSNKTTAKIPANSQPRSSNTLYPLCEPDDSALSRTN